MSAAPTVLPSSRARRGLADRAGDWVFYAVTGAAALGSVVLVVAIAWKIVADAHLSFAKFGLGFVTSQAWDPVKEQFGALDFIWGTAYTSFVALLMAGPLAIAIALFLTELAPRAIRDVVGSLVDMLAAVPSVVIGLWGILVLGPFLAETVDPVLQRLLGWTPFFSGEPNPSGAGQLSASVVLTIMAVPIIASVARELFLSVPRELEEGALALGLTRWETIRGVVLPYTKSGLVAAVVLGLGRAIGEAIAVTQVIGGSLGIHLSLFQTGDTIASRIASQYQGSPSKLQTSSLVYLAAILLAISLVTNLIAQLVVRRFEFQRVGAD